MFLERSVSSVAIEAAMTGPQCKGEGTGEVRDVQGSSMNNEKISPLLLCGSLRSLWNEGRVSGKGKKETHTSTSFSCSIPFCPLSSISKLVGFFFPLSIAVCWSCLFLHSVLFEWLFLTGRSQTVMCQYGEKRIGPWVVRMGPGAGLRMAWLRGGPCNRWWWWCGWGAGAAARSASWFEDAAAAIAAATAKGLGKSPAPKALVRSLEKVKED